MSYGACTWAVIQITPAISLIVLIEWHGTFHYLLIIWQQTLMGWWDTHSFGRHHMLLLRNGFEDRWERFIVYIVSSHIMADMVLFMCINANYICQKIHMLLSLDKRVKYAGVTRHYDRGWARVRCNQVVLLVWQTELTKQHCLWLCVCFGPCA